VTSFSKAFAHVRNCLLKKTTCYKVISIKHGILTTFNIKEKKLSDCMPLSTEVCLIMASSHEESNLNPFFFKSTFRHISLYISVNFLFIVFISSFQQIEEAKVDLKKKGFKFDSS
jgi:hypothetical protein